MTLSAYSESIVKPVSTCTLACKGKITSHVKFYVVSIDVQPILGVTDCIRLGLIQRVQVPNMSQKIQSELNLLMSLVD